MCPKRSAAQRDVVDKPGRNVGLGLPADDFPEGAPTNLLRRRACALSALRAREEEKGGETVEEEEEGWLHKWPRRRRGFCFAGGPSLTWSCLRGAHTHLETG